MFRILARYAEPTATKAPSVLWICTLLHVSPDGQLPPSLSNPQQKATLAPESTAAKALVVLWICTLLHVSPTGQVPPKLVRSQQKATLAAEPKATKAP